MTDDTPPVDAQPVEPRRLRADDELARRLAVGGSSPATAWRSWFEKCPNWLEFIDAVHPLDAARAGDGLLRERLAALEAAEAADTGDERMADLIRALDREATRRARLGTIAALNAALAVEGASDDRE